MERISLEKRNLSSQRKNEIKRISDELFKILLLFLLYLAASIIVVSVIFILSKGIAPFVNRYETSSGVVSQDILAFFTSSRWTYDGSGGMPFLCLTTIYVVFLSLLISVPISVFVALFISRIAPSFLKIIIKSAVDLLSSIPSVIYGLFGMGVINKLTLNLANMLNIQTFGGNSILSAIIVIAIMSIPTITTLSYSAIDAVSPSLIQASLALGASASQTNYKIVLKAAKSGIFAGIILGIGRALGEATAIQMVIGNQSNGLEFYNIFNIGSTLSTAMLTGLGEADGIGYDVRFSLGIMLMVVIIISNFILNYIKNNSFKDDTKIKRIYRKIKNYFKGVNSNE